MVDWLSASNSVQSSATMISGRGPTTKGTQEAKSVQTALPVLEKEPVDLLDCMLGVAVLRDRQRPSERGHCEPSAEQAPTTALPSEATRLAWRSSSKMAEIRFCTRLGRMVWVRMGPYDDPKPA